MPGDKAVYQFRFRGPQLGILLTCLLAVFALTFVLGYLMGKATHPALDWAARAARESRGAGDASPGVRFTAAEARGTPFQPKKLTPASDSPKKAEEKGSALLPLPSGRVPESPSRASAPVADVEGPRLHPVRTGLQRVLALAPPLEAERVPAYSGFSGREGRYYIQAGSFSDRGAARRQQETLRRNDYPAFVREADLGSKGKWYRVLIGRYESLEVANLEAERLARTQRVTPHVFAESDPERP